MAQAESDSPTLELAHVLFMDIVAYSKMPMEQQDRAIRGLQEAVRGTEEYRRAQAADQLITLPTGDGMALAFFGDAESAVRCAQELSTALQQTRDVQLRMGVHTGPVYRVTDINANRNVTGGGINMAQRVMDCGDAGHILISKATADVLHQLASWREMLHDLGIVEVKHGVKLPIFNLYRTGVGNAALPQKICAAKGQKRTKVALVLGICSVILAAAVVSTIFLKSHARTGIGGVSTRRAFALLGFKNLADRREQDWLSVALSQMMATELSAGQKLRTIPSESVARAKIELSIPDADSLSPETLQRLRNRLGADIVVLGSYLEMGSGLGEQIRLDVRLQETEGGETILSTSHTGTVNKLFDLVSQCGKDLRDGLRVGAVSEKEAVGVRDSLPADPEAARLYAQGLSKLHVFDNLGARERFEQAISIDGSNAQVHSALADAWRSLGYYGKGAEEAKRAMDLSEDLSLEDRLRVEGQYREALNDWPRAVEIYATLFGHYPDDLDYGLKLAKVQTSAGKLDDALGVVKKLKALKVPLRDDPRIDLAEGKAAAAAADNQRALAAHKQAAEKARAMGAQSLLGLALQGEGEDLTSLGVLQQALARLQEAQQIFRQTGDGGSEGRTVLDIGVAQLRLGNSQGARQSFEQALAIGREIGDTQLAARASLDLGNLLIQEGKTGEAAVALDRAIATSRQNGDRQAVEAALNTMAAAAYNNGELENAKKLRKQAADEARAISDPRGEAIALAGLADMLRDTGDLMGAKQAYGQVLAIFRSQGNKGFTATALEHLAMIEWTQGSLPEAQKDFEAALKLREEMGAAGDITLSKLQLAQLAVDQGRFEEAVPVLQALIAEFQKTQHLDREIVASMYLVSALLAERKAAEAQKVIEGLRPRMGNEVYLGLEIASARVLTAQGHSGEALAKLQTLAASSETQHGEPRFEVRLALGETELASGHEKEGRATLNELEKEARAKGYGLYGQKATKALLSK